MAYVYAFTNAKGGCGKTTVALNLAICFARAGYRTLAIDLDQQGNLSAGLFVREIVAVPDPHNRAWHRKQLERIVRRIRDNSVSCESKARADIFTGKVRKLLQELLLGHPAGKVFEDIRDCHPSPANARLATSLSGSVQM